MSCTLDHWRTSIQRRRKSALAPKADVSNLRSEVSSLPAFPTLAGRDGLAPDCQHRHVSADRQEQLPVRRRVPISGRNRPDFDASDRDPSSRDDFASSPGALWRENLLGGIWGSTFAVTTGKYRAMSIFELQSGHWRHALESLSPRLAAPGPVSCD